MNRIWFVIWAIVAWQVAVWAFAPEPKARPQVFAGDGKGYGDTEKYAVESRISQRRGAMAALELPWSGRCIGDTRKHFIEGLNEYYYHRQNQTERYPEIFGPAGADYIAKQWSTGEDKRIERLTQEAYVRGYFKPSDFNGVASKLIAIVVKGERVTGHACAG
ncbi:hypothetical protein EDE08_104237 [Bradyrhizobium sp. R2.2-H]|jgi:hypothetical protein|uniref:hypothetical protein n=1 Tax=unclassified Bradyrhizobium TaxID=2631580 RepID=UPI00104C126C|nr:MULTISPECIES: hypothetical protein [unclassified Bradyrhizobium]TCU73738.1 hypothetical protein EDE10_104405 [Bradyrhizobium sp. Y-H1]TCU76072.1 hypothetical protein EDE08_104237 [Bradyrhizobium sp. R2.2-H]